MRDKPPAEQCLHCAQNERPSQPPWPFPPRLQSSEVSLSSLMLKNTVGKGCDHRSLTEEVEGVLGERTTKVKKRKGAISKEAGWPLLAPRPTSTCITFGALLRSLCAFPLFRRFCLSSELVAYLHNLHARRGLDSGPLTCSFGAV